MTILNLVGLISLISLVAYFILYFIKPNYQQKFVSSTFIWKLSLKYKKKRIPINKLRNILLVICQILLLITLTIIIIKPAKVIKKPNDNEVVLVIDSSASMRTKGEVDTRYERAVDLATRKANEVLNNDGVLSIVISDNQPYFLFERESKDNLEKVNEALGNLVDPAERLTEEDELLCSYGKTDLNQAIALCTDILVENPSANVFVYTDTTADFVDKGINLVNVREAGEYNVAVTNAYSAIVDNYHMFTVELVSYGKDASIELTLDISGANATEDNPTGQTYTFVYNVDLTNDEPKKVVFLNADPERTNLDTSPNVEYYEIDDKDRIVSYESVHVSTKTRDSFEYDNYFDIYGGTKETIKVLYASSNANSFFTGAILVLESGLSNRYNIELDRFKDKTVDVPNSGYDLYIYEHTMMPSTAPTDGIVLYSDPLADVVGTGFKIAGSYDYNGQSINLKEEETHPILNKVKVDNITISRVVRLYGIPDGYQTLMSCDNRPAVLIRDTDDAKTIVLLFSMHYSNLALLKDFPIFMYNIFDYFLPQTVDGNSFEVNDKVEVKSRGKEVEVKGNGQTITIETFPNSVELPIQGSYEVSQTSLFGKEITDMIYVRIPAQESNIFLNVDSLNSPVNHESLEDMFEDILLWLSIALVSFLFLEWLLKGKDTL